MAGRDVVVIGASTGGVEALVELVRALPAGLPAALFVVCHFPAGGRSMLPEILSRRGPLLATHARDGEPTYPGHIYVAPPDHHLAVEAGAARVHRGPRENNFRPSIDVLFRSAARAYGPRVVGVLLSGAGADGLAGLLAVRGAGGLALVQDPADAALPVLPSAALSVVGGARVVPLAGLGARLAELIIQPAAPAGEVAMPNSMDRAEEVVREHMSAQANGARRGEVSLFTCPECGGCMWQLDNKALVQFRCHVGHSYLAESLLHEQSTALEAALWTAVRTFREKAVLLRQLANRDREAGDADSAARFDESAELAEQYGTLIQQYLLNGQRLPPAAGRGAGGPPGGAKP